MPDKLCMKRTVLVEIFSSVGIVFLKMWIKYKDEGDPKRVALTSNVI